MEFSYFLEGFLLGASLIIAIGSQNAFVLQQGILKQHIFLITTICFLSDALLIMLGGLGVGELISKNQQVLKIFSYGGALYLFAYGIIKLRSSLKKEQQTLQGSLNPNPTNPKTTKKSVVLQTLAFTFLNPHVYLDTVVLIGSFAANHALRERGFFLAGSALASMVWFYCLGYFSVKLSPYLARPLAWRLINFCIAIIMFYIGVNFLGVG